MAGRRQFNRLLKTKISSSHAAAGFAGATVGRGIKKMSRSTAWGSAGGLGTAAAPALYFGGAAAAAGYLT